MIDFDTTGLHHRLRITIWAFYWWHKGTFHGLFILPIRLHLSYCPCVTAAGGEELLNWVQFIYTRTFINRGAHTSPLKEFELSRFKGVSPGLAPNFLGPKKVSGFCNYRKRNKHYSIQLNYISFAFHKNSWDTLSKSTLHHQVLDHIIERNPTIPTMLTQWGTVERDGDNNLLLTRRNLQQNQGGLPSALRGEKWGREEKEGVREERETSNSCVIVVF